MMAVRFYQYRIVSIRSGGRLYYGPRSSLGRYYRMRNNDTSGFHGDYAITWFDISHTYTALTIIVIVLPN